MTDQQAYDQEFWRTVERLAAQVAFAAGNQAPAERKSFAPTTRPATPQPASGQEGETAGPTTRPAGPASGGNGEMAVPEPEGQPSGPTAPPATSTGSEPQAGAPSPADPASGTDGEAAGAAPQPGSGDGSAAAGEEKWIPAALSIAATVAPHVINAIRKRRKDFTPDLAADPEGEEKLASSVAEVVAPAIVDAIASRPKDFTVDLPSGAPNESEQDGAADEKFPWGAVARVAASAVPAIVSEVTKSKDFAPELAVDPAASGEKPLSFATIGPVAQAMINAWRNKRKDLGPEFGSEPDDGAGDDKFPWGAAARVAASVVPPLVGALTGKVYQEAQPPGRPQILPMPANGGRDGRYYIAS